MKGMLAIGAALLLGLSGCNVYREATSSRLPTDVNWQTVATPNDRDRLRDWRKAWDDALPRAQRVAGGAIAGDSALFDPDRALGEAMPPAGDYRCRSIQLGGTGTAAPDYLATPAQACRIEDAGKARRLAVLDGVQRPEGLFYPNTDARAIFLGTVELSDEHAPIRYGTDDKRNLIGYVERIAPTRWRLVMPYPRMESQLEIIEIVPA